MKEKNEFDFNMHYGEEKETPPSFLWDDLEKQLPKKRKGILWFVGVITVAASLLFVSWGIYHYGNSSAESNPSVEVQKVETKNNPNTLNEGVTGNNSLSEAEDNSSLTPSNTATKVFSQKTKGEKKGSDSLESFLRKDKQNIRLYVEDRQMIEDNGRNGMLQKTTDHTDSTSSLQAVDSDETIEDDSIPIFARQVEELEKTDSTVRNTSDDTISKRKSTLNFIVSATAFAHTYTFKNYNKGFSVGLAYAHPINKCWEARAGLSFMQISDPGLQRSSLREHYFITKTSTLQELDMTKLNYLSSSFKMYYKYKKYHFFGGLEALFLVNSKSSLRTTEIAFSEKTVVEKDGLIGYTKGVSGIVPQLTVGMGRAITKNIGVEVLLSHSITRYGSKTLYQTNSKFKLSYIGLGINWRIKK